MKIERKEARGDSKLNKREFLAELEDIIHDTIFIGGDTDDLNHEISSNMRGISMNQAFIDQCSVSELMDFFHRVIGNRKQQILNSKHEHGMLFYVWFDWMALQLRFCLISEFHEKLPFGCEIKILDELEPILHEFIDFPYHDGIPFEEGSEVEGVEMENSENESKPLHVFLIKLLKDS